MIKNSVIITESDYKSGIGKYAWYLYNLGLIENFFHLSYNGKSDFKNHIYFTNKWGVNVLYSYFMGGVYKKAVENMNFVHVSSLHHFHMVKYNKNTVGTLHDLFGIIYPMSKTFYYWVKMNLKFMNKLQGVVVISDHTKRMAENMFPDIDFKRIHHWLDDPYFVVRDKLEARKRLGLNEDKIYLLNVSTDIPIKNIDVLPNIFNKLDDRFVLIRIGDSERIVHKFKNKKQIIKIRDDVLSDEEYALYFNASDMLIHPVIDGGFERPYLEAIFSDLPIVTFDIPISKEVLKNHGIFVSLGKDKLDPEEWVDKILNYYDHKPDYSDLKEYYSKHRAKKEYENFYKSLAYI